MTLSPAPIALALAAMVLTTAGAHAQTNPVATPGAESAPATSSVAPSAQAAAPAIPAPTVAPAAPTEAAKPGLNPVAPAPEGMAQVVFFRPGAYVGMAVTFTVHEGNKGVARFGNNGYQAVAIPPGEHTFTVQSEATDKLTVEVDAGETYYVRETVGMGLLLLRPHLDLTSGPVFQSKALKLSTAKATDIASADTKPAT
jgi:hypothetical protein